MGVWEILFRGCKTSNSVQHIYLGKDCSTDSYVLWTLQREECEATMVSGFKLLAGPNF